MKGTSAHYATDPPQYLAAVTPFHVAWSLQDPELIPAIRDVLLTRINQNGKFGKFSVYYLPVTLLPPAAYFYECSTCTFYSPNNPNTNLGEKTCAIIDGIIEPYAWCGLWLPTLNDQPLLWLKQSCP